MPIVMHFSTFMKLLTLDIGGKIRQLERYAKPGGFDFYRASREGVYNYCAHGRDRSRVVSDVGHNSSSNSRDRNLEIFGKVADWLDKQRISTAVAPGRGVWPSPNKLFSVQIEPEIGFEKNSQHRIMSVYPSREPRISRDQAGAGILLLQQAYRGSGMERFGILDALAQRAFWTPTNVSPAILESEIDTIERELRRIF